MSRLYTMRGLETSFSVLDTRDGADVADGFYKKGRAPCSKGNRLVTTL